MLNFLHGRRLFIRTPVFRCISDKAKKKVKWDKCEDCDLVRPASQETAIRYNVCQDRVPVYKLISKKPIDEKDSRMNKNLQSLQPAMLPKYYTRDEKET